MRRLGVLCTAHRRTLHAVMPDHVVHLLRNTCGDANDANGLCQGTLQRQNNISPDLQPIPVNILNTHIIICLYSIVITFIYIFLSYI